LAQANVESWARYSEPIDSLRRTRQDGTTGIEIVLLISASLEQ
jgi:hypothetical protein